MKIAAGLNAYAADAAPVKAKGVQFSDAEVTAALEKRLPPILRDDAGKKSIKEFLSGVATTSFATDRLEKALSAPPTVQNWQVGESIAEAYLVDHHDCDFPWPMGRDLRNPNASPAGADLVGFQKAGAKNRFAFGEAKTSEEEKWPPQTMTSRTGLSQQIEKLRDSQTIKNHLVIIYLGHRAPNSAWENKYKESTRRYLNDPTDITLFGILVRDVAPKAEDLSSRAKILAKNCPTNTSIELMAFYLPAKTIGKLVSKLRLKGGKKS